MFRRPHAVPGRLALVFVFVIVLVSTPACTCRQEASEFTVPNDSFDLTPLQGSTLSEAFNAEGSLGRLEQVREALGSFTRMTDQSKGKFTQAQLEVIGNTGWETQVLGFHNWTGTIEGTLLYQDYQIRKLEFELVILMYEAGKIGREDVELEQKDYERSRTNLEEFLASYGIAD